LGITKLHHMSDSKLNSTICLCNTQGWQEYRVLVSEEEQRFITQDNGRWISLGLVVGEKE